jgi:hypothetical protein
MEYRRPTSQVLIGVLVVLLGVALLADTTGLYDTTVLLRYTPTLFVAVAVYAIVVSDFQNLFGPLAIAAVAGTTQLVVLGVVDAASLWQFWPVLVILFGLSVLAGRLRSRARSSDGSYLDAVAIFGGVERRVTSGAFRGATLSALFGGTELDLRDAVVAARPARVTAMAVFGGVEVIVPRDWAVDIDVLPILGGATDDRPRWNAGNASDEDRDRRRDRDHEAGQDRPADLVVTGTALFGGISVTD